MDDSPTNQFRSFRDNLFHAAVTFATIPSIRNSFHLLRLAISTQVIASSCLLNCPSFAQDHLGWCAWLVFFCSILYVWWRAGARAILTLHPQLAIVVAMALGLLAMRPGMGELSRVSLVLATYGVIAMLFFTGGSSSLQHDWRSPRR